MVLCVVLRNIILFYKIIGLLLIKFFFDDMYIMIQSCDMIYITVGSICLNGCSAVIKIEIN